MLTTCAFLLAFLPVQQAISCPISGTSPPILFDPVEGEDTCLGVRSPWCFHFKVVDDGIIHEEASGCAQWLRKVARHGKVLNAELADAAQHCDTHQNGAYNLTNSDGTISVECSSVGGNTTTTKYPADLTSGTPHHGHITKSSYEDKTTTATQEVCAVSESGQNFNANEGREICKNAMIDWCFDLNITFSWGEITASGCSAWVDQMSHSHPVHSDRGFLKKAFVICNHNHSAVLQEKTNYWNYHIRCSPASTKASGSKTTSTTPTTTPGTEPPSKTYQGSSTNEKSSEMTTFSTTEYGRKTKVCEIEGEVHGLFIEAQGKEICKHSMADWCFHYEEIINFRKSNTARGCSKWLDVVSERDKDETSRKFLKDTFILCSQNNSAGSHMSWMGRYSFKVTCSPAVDPMLTTATSIVAETTAKPYQKGTTETEEPDEKKFTEKGPAETTAEPKGMTKTEEPGEEKFTEKGPAETTAVPKGMTKTEELGEEKFTEKGPVKTTAEPNPNGTTETASEARASSEQPPAENRCHVSATPGSFDEQEGWKICQKTASSWCFHFTSTIFKGLFAIVKVSGCSQWMETLVHDPKLNKEQRLFFAEAHKVCSNDNMKYHMKRWPWLFKTNKVVCSPINSELGKEMKEMIAIQGVRVPGEQIPA